MKSSSEKWMQDIEQELTSMFDSSFARRHSFFVYRPRNTGYPTVMPSKRRVGEFRYNRREINPKILYVVKYDEKSKDTVYLLHTRKDYRPDLKVISLPDPIPPF